MKKYYEMDNDLKDKKINVYVSNHNYGKTYHEFQKIKNKLQMFIDTINELLDEGKITVYVYDTLMDILLK